MATPTSTVTLRELVAQNRLEQALETLVSRPALPSELSNEATLLRGRLEHATSQVNQDRVSEEDARRERTRIARAVLALLANVEREGADQAPAAPAASVFISYSHTQAPAAMRLRDYLRGKGLRVIIDVDDLAPSEPISKFIRRSVKDADATVGVVSFASLDSAWVIFEAITAMAAEEIDTRTRYIACSLDDQLFRREFRLEVTQRIDDRLAEIARLMREYDAKQIGVADLVGEQTRLMRMRVDLGTVLDRLRETLTLRLDGDSFEPTADAIARYVLRNRS